MSVGLTMLLLALTILTPLLLPLLLWWPARREVALRLAPAAALPALLLALTGAGEASLPLPWFFLGAELGLDATGRIFLLFTSWLWLIAAWFATGFMAADRRSHLFLLFFLPAMAGNFGLILARDLISFNTFFTLMGLSAYGLVIHHRNYAALRAGRIYLALVVLGEALIFIGMVGLVRQTGGLVHFSALADSGGLAAPLVACLLLGFGIKAGMVPLHFWLPLAHPAAPVPASAVLSGAMIKAGLLGWLRFLPAGDAAPAELGTICLLLGLIAAFYGALRGLSQDDPKTVLAWSSVSQMGLLTVGLGLLLGGGEGQEPALAAIQLYAVHHALAKGALFLTVGVAGSALYREKIKSLRFGQRMAIAAKRRGAIPLSELALLAAALPPALSLAGAPLTSGFAAKNLLLSAAGQAEPLAAIPFLAPIVGTAGSSHNIFALLLGTGSLLTALLMLHFLQRLRTLLQRENRATATRETEPPLKTAGVAGQSGLLSPLAGFGLLLPLAALIIPALPFFWRLVPPLADLLALAPAAAGWSKTMTALLPLILAPALAWLGSKSGLIRPKRQASLSSQAGKTGAESGLEPGAKSWPEPGPVAEPRSKEEGRLALISLWWQRRASRLQNARAAAHCRRRRLLNTWRQDGRRAEELIASWPLAGCYCTILILLFFLLAGWR